MSYYGNRRYNPPAELRVAPHGAVASFDSTTPAEFEALVLEFAYAFRGGEGSFLDRPASEILSEIMEAFKKGPSQ